MASLSKTYSQEKLFGQVYTPSFIVNKILDDCGYNETQILAKKIIDPACGDGRFLEEIVRRIIQFSPKEKLAENLSYIYGWDIDEEAIDLCIKNLDEIISPFQININWNISVRDSLEHIFDNQYQQTFDYIVANPPYIRIQHLEEKQRRFIQQNYTFCQSGSTDIFIAFYELALHLLKKEGCGGFITTNSFLYSETARIMRQEFEKNQNIRQITNYADIQLFENVSTYSSIFIFGQKSGQKFLYEKAIDEQNFQKREIDFSEITGHKTWKLSIENGHKIEGKKLNEIAKIHVGITTLQDKSYIFPVEPLDDNFVWANTRLKGKVKLEKAILRPIIKGSKYKGDASYKLEYVLFPYQKSEDKNQIIPEETLKSEFPLAYQYLLSVKDELDKRDNGKTNPVAWYAFGRSQGLDTSFGKKIIFSPMAKEPNFILSENEEATVYSGYFIKYPGDYEKLLTQLNTQRMADFVAISSRDFRGGWKAYGKKVIEDFIIDTKLL